MIYHDLKELKISALGLSNNGLIYKTAESEEAALFTLKHAYEEALSSGVNYFELYQGYGQKDPAADFVQIMKDVPRENYVLSLGFKGYEMDQFAKPAEVFEAQLESLGAEMIDLYVLHNVTEFNIKEYLESGIVEYFLEQKAAGKIKYLGCDFFANYDPMKRFLEKYGDAIDFARFDINWMDWDFHHAKLKVNMAKKYSLPIITSNPLKPVVMEHIDCDVEAGFTEFPKIKESIEGLKAFRPDEKMADWAIHYLQTMPEIISGLVNVEDWDRSKEALKAIELDAPASKEESALLYEIGKQILPRKYMPCTGCRKCMPHCIKHLDIAGFMDIYNEELVSGYQIRTPMYVYVYESELQPQACCHWGPCQSMCPKHYDIIHTMLPLSTKARRNPLVK